jgi:hypothetical protein
LSSSVLTLMRSESFWTVIITVGVVVVMLVTVTVGFGGWH